MSNEKFIWALDRELPVLFVYIGWANDYTGREAIRGGHGYLVDHPYDNSEARAFVREDGRFRCGIGRGAAPGRLHIVFVAHDPFRNQKRIVGVYADAVVEEERDVATNALGEDRTVLWSVAVARNVAKIPVDRRPKVAFWPAGQGQRRWATRQSGGVYPKLYQIFKRLKKSLPSLLTSGKMVAPDDDQTYEYLGCREGQQRMALRKERRREARLRNAKISQALNKNGRLVCEVPRCAFDFSERYGKLGVGYAHVHHLAPLSGAGSSGRRTGLDDLAIVCANCHAMIHKGGECRDIRQLIPRSTMARRPKRS